MVYALLTLNKVVYSLSTKLKHKSETSRVELEYHTLGVYVRVKRIGVMWFGNDLRLHDNRALVLANSLVDELVCVVIDNEIVAAPKTYTQVNQGRCRLNFAAQSLHEFSHHLLDLGNQLIYIDSNALESLSFIVNSVCVTDVFRSTNAGYYENRLWRSLERYFPSIQFHSIDTHTLFDQDELPFALIDLPSSFTKFKNAVSDISPSKPLARVCYLPPMPSVDIPRADLPPLVLAPQEGQLFVGGESMALSHLHAYFQTQAPAEYKTVRNKLEGWSNSTKLSAWLANGNLSAREAYSALIDYELNVISNESTYWIYFELLWREYFQWYAHKNGKQLFSFAGINGQNPLISYYPERFRKWISGNTPFSIVNACMKELAATGYLSNRGRQIAASCFVNELAMDWRFGAAYFESVLIDYDVASNWGNWQYLAGVGADTRGKRHFNLEKQTQMYDPDHGYIDKWCGQQALTALDSVDVADWPIA